MQPSWLTRFSLKTRLYCLIAFLGLLPVVSLLIALLTMRTAQEDYAVLDRAVRGTIYLERINGLVYAIVMDSRGIYMSPDWKTAEPYGKGMQTGLARLREVAQAWRINASAAHRSNVDELARRIEQFMQFRTELVRLAKEESTAVARVFGDNNANRSVRTALNESLIWISRAYEEEIDRARHQLEVDNRSSLYWFAGAAVLSIAAFGLGLLLVKVSLVTPLIKLKSAMMRLANGDFTANVDDLMRADEIGDMARTITIFHVNAVDRHKLNREAQLLAELNEWLQSCKSLAELYHMVGEFLSRLLPGCAGHLFVYSNSRDILESAQVWHGGRASPGLHPDDCWGLRRGRTYTFGDHEIDFRCSHVAAGDADAYSCIPIVAHGEAIGLLHLVFGRRGDMAGALPSKDDMAEQRRLGVICAEQISMAIANVKLRDQLRDQSIRDPLTGLFNRRYLMETCRREFSRAQRLGQEVSLLSLDVDHFKLFNDNHGHDAGDTVLRALGECLKTHFRDEDVPCRFGGEEFVVILPGATAENGARRADELRCKVEALVVRYIDANLPKVTISVGVAAFPQCGGTPEGILKAADDALYRAKAAGRNRVVLASSGEAHAAGQTPASADATRDGADCDGQSCDHDHPRLVASAA